MFSGWLYETPEINSKVIASLIFTTNERIKKPVNMVYVHSSIDLSKLQAPEGVTIKHWASVSFPNNLYVGIYESKK
jgi:hypothetical protein